MSDKVTGWTSFSESEVVWPFNKSDDALDKCRMRFNPAEDFSEESVFQFEHNPILEEGFEPEIEITVDTQRLIEKTGLPENLLSFSFVVRDRAIRRFILIEKGDLSKLNNTSISVPLETVNLFSGRRGLEFVVIITAKPSNFTQYQAGDKIAERVFPCTLPIIDNSSFPFGYLDPDSESWPKEYPKETVYFISWKPTEKIFEPNIDIAEALTVYFNSKYTDRVQPLNQKNPSLQSIWKQICIDIFIEISLVILGEDTEDPPSSDDKGFYAKVVQKLEGLFEKSLLELRAIYASDISFISKLRSKLQTESNLLNDLKTLRA